MEPPPFLKWLSQPLTVTLSTDYFSIVKRRVRLSRGRRPRESRRNTWPTHAATMLTSSRDGQCDRAAVYHLSMTSMASYPPLTPYSFRVG